MRNISDPFRPIERLIKIKRPLLTIPHLAIHFNRQVNDGNPISRQRDMLPICAILKEGESKDNLIYELVARELGIDASEILDSDLTLFDTTGATTFGLNDEFISSGRIDDLMMAHAAISALVDEAATPCAQTRIAAIFDNEETGSGTKQGAASPVLQGILTRINDAHKGSNEDYELAIANTFMISADNAHGFHPNYPDKMDPTNHPVLGGGPVVKINANCKYMTDGDSAAVFRRICELAEVPCQYFVNHSDVAGGSTLGNILTSQIPVRGVDIGAPQLAMHSCRETAAVIDHLYTVKAFRTFFSM